MPSGPMRRLTPRSPRSRTISPSTLIVSTQSRSAPWLERGGIRSPIIDRSAPSAPSQMGRFETSAMTTPTNLTALADLSGRWIDRAQARRARTALVLDIDSSVSPTYGAQEGTAYNGHFACTCYHPLFVFNQDGDLERCALWPGNVHSAHGWREVLDPVVARYRGQAHRRFLCDASTRASAIGRRAGTGSAGWWRRSSGIPASCTRALDSS